MPSPSMSTAVRQLTGIVPVILVPFDERGDIDEEGLRRIVRFELEEGVQGIGVNGFASEAYKLTDTERLQVARIVADEVAGDVPLVIGLAPGSVEGALSQAKDLAPLEPAAMMTLPPSTFGIQGDAVVEFYSDFSTRAPAPIMVQQAPHIHAYSASLLEADQLATVSEFGLVTSFKLEGPAAADRIFEFRTLVPNQEISVFGGGGGMTFLAELRAGVDGLIPGVGFNEGFVAAWNAWQQGNPREAERLLTQSNPLVEVVSGAGHEFSLHARKRLLFQAGLISTPLVRRPTVPVSEDALEAVESAARAAGIRLFDGGRQ
jgi:4-hydroxy-tetrahydrodipicolinate synthase